MSRANGHITLNTPVLVRSLKLSSVEPSQYLDGWPPGNTGCCWQPVFLFWQICWFLQQARKRAADRRKGLAKFWQIKKPEHISLWTNALWLGTSSLKPRPASRPPRTRKSQTSRALSLTLKKKTLTKFFPLSSGRVTTTRVEKTH